MNFPKNELLNYPHTTQIQKQKHIMYFFVNNIPN